jgi:ankyrin repeat protein
VKKKVVQTTSNNRLILFSTQKARKDYKQLERDIDNYLKEQPASPSNSRFLNLIEAKEFSKALRLACASGKGQLVEPLINYLQKTKALDRVINECTASNGKTPLHWAVKWANKVGQTNKPMDFSILLLLCQAGADRNIKDYDGKTFSDYLSPEDQYALNLSVTCLATP